MNDKGFTKEQLAALKHGDEVALAYGRRYDAHWRVHRIERRTDATIWLTDGRRARASDGKVVGESYEKIWPITDDIRAAIPQSTVFTHLESIDDPVSWKDVGLERGPER
jgi:hypothetical protein